MTQTLYLKPSHEGDIALAAKMLISGKLVAFPTETVYGLGANALDLGAIQRIFEVKRRPTTNPLILHVANAAQARTLFDFEGSVFSELFEARFKLLSEKFWPGPLTFVGKKGSQISGLVTGGSDKVAVRVPSHPVALELLAFANLPIAAPSANLFTRPSPTSHEHVALNFDAQIDAVVDGGQTDYGIESTVIDIDAERPKILRHGVISSEELMKFLPDLVVNPIGAQKSEGDASPGLSVRHYAPQIAHVRLASQDELAKAWFASSGLILRSASAKLLEHQLGKRPAFAGPTRALPDNPKGFARELFEAFYEMEAKNPECLMVEDLLGLSADPEWASICDKILRATTLN
jgi:L-threonylcarbamoyladenylate synthase